MVERTGPTLAIVGSCGGCPHLRPSTVGGHRLGFVDCAHPLKPVPFIGNVNTSITTPADCPELAPARLALGRALVAADIAGPARGVEGLMCCPDVSTFEATEARFACKVAMGLVKWTSSAPHEAQEESDQ